MASRNIPRLLTIITVLIFINKVSCYFIFSPDSVELPIGTTEEILFNTNGEILNENETIKFKNEYREIATIMPTEIVRDADKKNTVIHISGQAAGRTIITAYIPGSDKEAYLLVTVVKSRFLHSVSIFFCTMHSFLWSVVFYPQLYENYMRKSVVGLSFDFVTLSLIGFLLYSVYNYGLYYIPSLLKEYYNRHPKSTNPVEFSDVFFSVHGLMTCAVCIGQCIIYEKENQEVSSIVKIIIIMYYNTILITGVCAYMKQIHWLDFLSYCSYVKLSTTIIKFIPQALMNYNRKSTVGWSIGYVILDFGRGCFSILQMLIDGYNYNDYENIIGDPTRFQLGLFLITFDILFIYQHYVLYWKKPKPVMVTGSFAEEK